MALIQRLRILHGKLHKERIILKGMTHRAVTTQNQDADDYPIDFVVTWVDGNDQAWREEKEQYWSRIHGGEVSIKGNGFERYRDWDQFMYWFRAVEMYAPWVRYVYLVTWGHVPKWLNLNHPKLRIIKHPDYIDREYLPTFQSIPIEINLHRINDLSEHFVYFNDDQLLTSPVLPVDFFVGGVPKHCAIAYPVRNYAYNGPFAHQQFSVIGLLNDLPITKLIEKNSEKWFNRVYGEDVRYNRYAFREDYLPGLFFNHLPYPLNKTTMTTVWERFSQQMDQTCRHRFRTSTDITTQIFTMYDMVTGNFIPVNKDYYGKMFGHLSTQANEVADAIRSRQFRVICYNDSVDVTEENFEEIRAVIETALKDAFPNKSSFEL